MTLECVLELLVWLFVVPFYVNVCKPFLCYGFIFVPHSASSLKYYFLKKFVSNMWWLGSIKINFDETSSWLPSFYRVWLFTVEGYFYRFGGKIFCMRLCPIYHPRLPFFAVINVLTRSGISLQNTLWFLIFRMLHRSITNPFILTSGLEALYWLTTFVPYQGN